MLKPLFSIILLLALSALSLGQQATTPQHLKRAHYLKLSKRQQTGAWILLGGGASFVITGITVGFRESAIQIGNLFFAEPEKTTHTGEILFCTGLAAMAGSIPFFIASSRNKNKAKTISASIKMETHSTVQQRTIVEALYPAVSLKFSL